MLALNDSRLVEARMHAMPNDSTHDVTPPDTYYSPSRVRDLLRLYPYLLDTSPPRDPDMQEIIRRVIGPSGWKEEAICKRADIFRGIVWLEKRSPEAAYILRGYFCVGLPLRALESYIEREFHRQISHETVRRWRDDAVQLVSDFLCGALA